MLVKRGICELLWWSAPNFCIALTFENNFAQIYEIIGVEVAHVKAIGNNWLKAG